VIGLPAILAITLGLSLTAYAVLAGADFGAGILDLGLGTGGGAAGDLRRADRDAIAVAIGPLWEANHVWLIFSITIFFSAFPRAFSAVGTGLLAPFVVALLAIVVRSVALGVRGSAVTSSQSRVLLGTVFGAASLVAPFAFGTIAGGLAEASVTAPDRGAMAPAIPWSSPFALVIGALAVALCAQLAAGFVALRCARAAQPVTAARFARRMTRSGIVVLVLMAAAVAVAALAVPQLFDRLVGAALPAVVAAVMAEAAALAAISRRRYASAYCAAFTSAVMVLWGWFTAQAPRLVGPRLTLHTAAATHTALVAVAVAVGAVLVAVIPAMFLLFALFNRPATEVLE
jgi:cytochrome d ubiquinol oxidase subunit II